MKITKHLSSILNVQLIQHNSSGTGSVLVFRLVCKILYHHGVAYITL